MIKECLTNNRNNGNNEKTWAKKTIGLSNINIVDWASALKVEVKGRESADLADFPHPNERMPMPVVLK